MDQIERLAQVLKNSKRLCVFTGAGISVPSGIPDFRSANGLYNTKTKYPYAPEQMISHSFFVGHSEMFWDFYKSVMLFPDAKPNDAHRFFATLETPERSVAVVTQNIDGLHQAAGSTKVFELHGSVHRNYCQSCGKFFSLDDLLQTDGVPHCDKCGGVIKPDVVLYEEPLDEACTRGAVKAIAAADVLIVAGTSLTVYPAAGFLNYFQGRHLVLINRDATPYDDMATLVMHEKVGEALAQIRL